MVGAMGGYRSGWREFRISFTRTFINARIVPLILAFLFFFGTALFFSDAVVAQSDVTDRGAPTLTDSSTTGSPVVTEKNLDQLVSQLSSGEFQIRENATATLDLADDRFLPELEIRLERISDLEAKTRLHGVVARKKFEQQQKNRQIMISN